MYMAISGSLDGDLIATYKVLEALEEEIKWLVCVGNFGAWPDPGKISRASKKHMKHDFSKLYLDGWHKGWKAPISTLFIAGTHEDNHWLTERYNMKWTEVIPGIHWLAQGHQTVIGDTDESIRVTGLGRSFSPETYSGKQTKKSYRHYTRAEVHAACSGGPTDLVLTYEGPEGKKFDKITSTAKGIRNILYAVRPQLYVHGAYNVLSTYSCLGVPTFSLSKKELLLAEVEGGKIFIKRSIVHSSSNEKE